MMRNAGRIFVLLFFSLLGLAAAGLTRNEPLPVLGTLPEFSLTDSEGNAFGRANLSGKISLVSFFFASCRGPCPRLNAELDRLRKSFSDDSNIQLVSVSIDGERDTPAALAEYAKKFGSPKNWHFLTGPPDSVAFLSEETFKLAVDKAEKIHSTRIVLVDSENQIRGSYSSEDEAARMKLLRDIESF